MKIYESLTVGESGRVDIYEIGLMMRWIWNNKNSVGTLSCNQGLDKTEMEEFIHSHTSEVASWWRPSHGFRHVWRVFVSNKEGRKEDEETMATQSLIKIQENENKWLR